MKKVFALLVGLSFLLIPASQLWAKIERVDGRKCNAVAAVTQGGSQIFTIQGPGVDLTTGLSVSNSALSASIRRKWNGGENARDGGNILWGKIEISVTASAGAPVANHTVWINYPIGRDSLTVRVIAKARITGATVPTFSQPFQGTVDVKLTGVGLSSARVSSVKFKRDAYTPLLDSSGQEVPPLQYNVIYITGAVNTSTNTDTQVDVRLTFASSLPRLTKATIDITLSPNDGSCSGLPASYTFTLTAPLAGPNYVASHSYDHANQSYRIGDTVTITIRLDRPARSTLSRIDPRTGARIPIGENLYWAVIPPGTIQQGGAPATPYDPNARYNTIHFAEGQQVEAINFVIKACTAAGPSQTQTVKFITWKPDPNNDAAPNRRESNFTISCQ